MKLRIAHDATVNGKACYYDEAKPGDLPKITAMCDGKAIALKGAVAIFMSVTAKSII